jgi:hypothetical protein
MSENWSVDDDNPWLPRKLIASNTPTSHVDERMHWTLHHMARFYNPPLVKQTVRRALAVGGKPGRQQP